MSNKTIWKIIKECCETDSETAVILLEAAGMACENNLRKVFILRAPDYIFRVPNYCICDPLFERDYDSIKDQFKNKKEININIVCFYMQKNKNYELQVTNKTRVVDVKKMFAQNAGINYNNVKIRFLFKGQELLDDNLLCYNDVEDMSKIQVVVNNL